MKTQMLCDSHRGNHTVHLEKTCFSGPAVSGAVLNSLIYRKKRTSAELPLGGGSARPLSSPCPGSVSSARRGRKDSDTPGETERIPKQKEKQRVDPGWNPPSNGAEPTWAYRLLSPRSPFGMNRPAQSGTAQSGKITKILTAFYQSCRDNIEEIIQIASHSSAG